MNVLQSISAFFRAPDAAALAAQAAQGADWAARQGAVSMRRDSEHDRERVLAADAATLSAGITGDRQGPEALRRPLPRRMAPQKGQTQAAGERRHIDIIA
jgi:hypothetical protein